MVTAIKAKAVIDGTGAKPLENAVVIVEGSTIKAVEQQGQVSIPEGPNVQTLDFPNGYLLPGLLDSHTHLMFGVQSLNYEEVIERDSDEIMLLRAAKNALTHLKCGVTTLRDNGARNCITFNLREGAQRGYITAPRLLLCGRPVTVTGGHFYWCNQEADGVEEVRAAVRQLVKEGADHIKIMASGGGTAITDTRRPYYTVEELKAAVVEAHNLGKPTTAHCLATQSIANALDAGVDMIEHCWFVEPDGSYRFHPEIAERIAAQGTYVSPTPQPLYREYEALLEKERQGTLAPGESFYGYTLDILKASCETRVKFIGRMHKEWGIKVISGTDAIQTFGDYCLGLELMSQAGMSNMDVIKASTSVSAKAMGVGHLVGTVEPGKEADLIVVDQDPLKDIKALRTMVMVMRAGERIL